MNKDHTTTVEKRLEAIQVSALDTCAFYTPKKDRLLAINLCAYCKHGDFVDQNNQGFCLYGLENKRRQPYEK